MSEQIYCSLCGKVSCFCYYCVLCRGTVCNGCADKFHMWKGPLEDMNNRNTYPSNKAGAASKVAPNASESNVRVLRDGDW